MNTSKVNKIVEGFIRGIDMTDVATETIVSMWFAKENQEQIFGKKVRRKNPYLCFREVEMTRLRNLDPPIVKRSEFNPIISENWTALKEAGGDEYEKYTNLSNGDIKPEYEITKPYHKFCVEKRPIMENEYDTESAADITIRLSDTWMDMTRSSKSEWDL